MPAQRRIRSALSYVVVPLRGASWKSGDRLRGERSVELRFTIRGKTLTNASLHESTVGLPP